MHSTAEQNLGLGPCDAGVMQSSNSADPSHAIQISLSWLEGNPQMSVQQRTRDALHSF